MPVDPEILARLTGRPVRLTFEDGEASIVRLISVDMDEHEDVVYELLRTIVPATRAFVPGDLLVAPLAGIVSAGPAPDEPHMATSRLPSALSAARREYAPRAAAYDRRWRAYVERSLEMLRPHLEDADLGAVLDVGCGTTAVLRRLARWKVPFRRYVGVDATPEMLWDAARTLSATDAVLAADAAALPLSGASFDLAISASSLHEWMEPERGLAEVRRVLKPGARLLLVDWCRDGVAMRALNGWMRLTGKRYRRMYTSGEAEAMLRGAGFRIVAREHRAIGFPWRLMLFACVAA
jgi:ubiquinone/menaquinone biosynthesis C-methylase UbiE